MQCLVIYLCKACAAEWEWNRDSWSFVHSSAFILFCFYIWFDLLVCANDKIVCLWSLFTMSMCDLLNPTQWRVITHYFNNVISTGLLLCELYIMKFCLTFFFLSKYSWTFKFTFKVMLVSSYEALYLFVYLSYISHFEA